MNSNLSLTDVLGKVCCGFFQELVLHAQFARLPLKFAKPRPLTDGQRRLLLGMLTTVGVDPITKGRLVDTEFLGDLAIGREVSITIFTASSLNSGEKLLFGRGNCFYLSRLPILLDGLSGNLGEPQLARSVSQT